MKVTKEKPPTNPRLIYHEWTVWGCYVGDSGDSRTGDWADRFFAAPLDDEHLWTAVRYVELNPVRAGIVANALDYPWSSARCHAGLAHSTLLDAGRPFPGACNDWATYLAGGVSDPDIDKLRWCTSTGRPFGSEEFLHACEEDTGRILRPMKPGPKVSPSASTDLSEKLFGSLK